jgi:hypothetical protein
VSRGLGLVRSALKMHAFHLLKKIDGSVLTTTTGV